jgi:UDP:flavonoid glycosyltransferase YjiC (YdhE family)
VTVRREKAGAEALASTLRRLLDDPAMAARCHEMGARLREEDGAVVAVDRLEQLVSV